MNSTSIVILADPAALAQRAADRLCDLLGDAISARGSAALALAGGSTPRAMNARLSEPDRRSRVDWSRVRFFFGDERCVPPDHADSNFRMTNETLFVPLGIAPAAIFRIAGEDDPQAAAAAYASTLASTLGEPPVFDVVLLGMGPDGHTASLFPGTIATLDQRRYAVANFVPKFNAYRITLTPPVINAARHVVVTAAGAEKAEALTAVINGPREPDRFPTQLVAPRSGNLEFLVDAAAGAGLGLPVEV